MKATTHEAGEGRRNETGSPERGQSDGSSRSRGRNRRSRGRGGNRGGGSGGSGQSSGSDGPARESSGGGGRGSGGPKGGSGGGGRGGGGGSGGGGSRGGKGGSGQGRRRTSQGNRRGRSRRQKQPQDTAGFWGDAAQLPEPKTDVRITDDPDAVPRSLGTPPLPGQEAIAGHYFAAVYDRAVATAGALAAAGGLIDPNALTEDED